MSNHRVSASTSDRLAGDPPSYDTIGHCMLCPEAEVSQYKALKAMMHPEEKRFQFMRCDSCGLVYLDPRLLPEALTAYYGPAYLPYRGGAAWGKYASMVNRSLAAVDTNRVQWLSRHRSLSATDTLLDLGCGKPSFLHTAVEQLGCKGLGIDFSDEGWRDDTARYSQLQLEVGEVKDLSLTHAASVITAWHYLEHDYHPIETLRQLTGFADQDTLLVIEVPDHDSDSRRQHGEHWAGYHVPRHTYLFDPKTIRITLEQAGWEVIEIDRKGTLDSYNLHWMSGAEQRNIDWEASMEPKFMRYVAGMLAHRVKGFFSRKQASGIMTIAARLKGQ